MCMYIDIDEKYYKINEYFLDNLPTALKEVLGLLASL